VPSGRKHAVALTAVLTLLATGCGGGQSSTNASSSAAPTQPGAASPPAKASTPALIPPPGAPPHSVRVPVLTYHRVHTMPAVGQPDLIVDPANFAAELEALRASGYHTIHQSQLFDALYKGGSLPAKPIIISVDDGYVDDIRTILPDLQRMHMVAAFFVITGRTSEPGFLSADQIRQLDRAGMDVGDHTAHHLDLPALPSSELRAETAGSRQALEAILGHPVYYFAYPFGAYNGNVLQAVHRAGFTLAYTTAGGITERTQAPLTMPRVHVGRAETPGGLLSLLGGT